jgi:hypothetical protein
MSTNRTSGVVVIVAGLWSAALAPTMGQKSNCPAWEQKHPARSPSPRYGHRMAYDSARGVTVLFGGLAGAAGQATWEWDGHDWMERSASGPPPRDRGAMAYDELRGVTVLFGGSGLGDTSEWDGVQWTLRSNTGPSPRFGHAMAYDKSRGVSVLFGGRSGSCGPSAVCGDTWEWNGSQWELRATTGPAPRWDHAMAYDSRRHVTVLYGGVYSSETWEWDGQVWLLRTSFVGPELRVGHSMAYDSLRGATLLFSGFGPEGADSQTWAWDGTTWTLLSGVGPPRRDYSAMAYDSARAVTVVFGGYLSDTHLFGNDTWELPSCPRDSDGDGVIDANDECDVSDLRSTIVIDDCDSGVANHLFDDGCTMADRIGECLANAGNHGSFVSCVAQLTHDWVDEGVITPRDKGPIQRCAAQADVPQPHVNGRNLSKVESTAPTETLWRR